MKKIVIATMLVLSALTTALATTEARLHSVDVFRGSAIGTLDNLRTQDVRVYSVTADNSGLDWTVTAGAHVTAAATQRIDIRVRAQKTTAGAVQMHMLDWRLNAWVPMAALNFGVNRMTTCTLSILSNASRWVVPGGSIRLRFVAANGTMFTDQVRITVN